LIILDSIHLWETGSKLTGILEITIVYLIAKMSNISMEISDEENPDDERKSDSDVDILNRSLDS
jgi:hypothetical protein